MLTTTAASMRSHRFRSRHRLWSRSWLRHRARGLLPHLSRLLHRLRSRHGLRCGSRLSLRRRTRRLLRNRSWHRLRRRPHLLVWLYRANLLLIRLRRTRLRSSLIRCRPNLILIHVRLRTLRLHLRTSLLTRTPRLYLRLFRPHLLIRLRRTNLLLVRLCRTHLRLTRPYLHLLLRLVGPRHHRSSHRPLHTAIRRNRTRIRDHRRTSPVRVVELLPVLHRLLPHLQLRIHGSKPRLTPRRNLRRTRTNLKTSTAAVVRDPVVHHSSAVHHHCPRIHIRDARNVHACNGAVVEEVVPAPIASVEAISRISESIVDAAVEADIPAPVAAMEAIPSAIEAPVARRPQRSRPRRRYPHSRNPVIAHGSIAPVTRSPYVVRLRRWRLLVSRQLRWRLLGIQLIVGRLVVRVHLRIVIRSLLLLILRLRLLLVRRRSPLLRPRLLILLRPLHTLVLNSRGDRRCRLLGLGRLLLVRILSRLRIRIAICGSHIGVCRIRPPICGRRGLCRHRRGVTSKKSHAAKKNKTKKKDLKELGRWGPTTIFYLSIHRATYSSYDINTAMLYEMRIYP